MAICAQTAAEGESGSGVVRDYRNENVLAVWRYMPTLGWGIVTKMDLKELLGPAVVLRNLMIASCINICILIFIASSVIAESIANPIRVLCQETEIIAGGDFDHKVGMNRKDEIGKLSRAFDNMSGHLKKSTISIDRMNHEIVWRKKTQDALQKSEAYLAVTLASIGDAVIVTNAKGIITFINPVCEKLSGWEKEDAVGKSLIEIFNVVNGNTDMPEGNPVERVLKENVIVELTDNTVLIAKDGTRCPIDDSASPIRDKEGGIIGIVLVFHDITERKKKEEELKKATDMKSKFADVVLEAQKSMAILANEKGLDITTKLDEHLPQIKFDRDRVIQVLTNLTDNAMKFTEKGAVSITVQQQDNTAHVMVRDTGPGIKTEDLPKLFQTFEQLDNTNCHKKEGTGLGLAISKEIVLFHQGKIWAESEFGKGSTFHFTLPL